MDCFINLTPMTRQFYQLEALVTNSPVENDTSLFGIGNLGAETNLKREEK